MICRSNIVLKFPSVTAAPRCPGALVTQTARERDDTRDFNPSSGGRLCGRSGRRALTSLFSPDPAHTSCLLPPGLLDSCPVDSPITPRAIVTHCHITLTSSLLRFYCRRGLPHLFQVRGRGGGDVSLCRVRETGKPIESHTVPRSPTTRCELMCCDKHIQICSRRNKRPCIVSIKSKLASGCLPQAALVAVKKSTLSSRHACLKA